MSQNNWPSMPSSASQPSIATLVIPALPWGLQGRGPQPLTSAKQISKTNNFIAEHSSGVLK